MKGNRHKARSLQWAKLAEQTWLLLPAGLAARTHFDAFAAQFPHPPVTHPVVTRSLPMLWRLLRHRDLLALLPLNLARPLLEAGDLVELRVGEWGTMEPMGILQPQGIVGDASRALSDFLQAFSSQKTEHRAKGKRLDP